MRRALGAVLVAAALLTASCGGGTRENANRRAGPAPKLDGVELRGQIPGEKAEGVYRDERGRTVKDVHRLLAVGDGDRRSVLLLGRRNGTPCVGAARAGDDRVELACFEHWENPPLFLRSSSEAPRAAGPIGSRCSGSSATRLHASPSIRREASRRFL